MIAHVAVVYIGRIVWEQRLCCHLCLLLVPQFTLAADTDKGTRAGFSTAAPPEEARTLFTYLMEQARAAYPTVASGVFGANMQVSLVNDGPVTFWLET